MRKEKVFGKFFFLPPFCEQTSCCCWLQGWREERRREKSQFSQAITQHTGGKKIWKVLSRVPHNFTRAPNALKFFNIAVNSSFLVSCRGKGFCMYTREDKGRIRGIFKKRKSKSIFTPLPLRNACFLNGRFPPSIYPEHPKIDSRRRRIQQPLKGAVAFFLPPMTFPPSALGHTYGN